MFDFDKEEMMAETVPMNEFEWDKITAKHSKQEYNASRDAAIKAEGKREAFQDFYQQRHRHRKDTVAVAAGRYALVSLSLSAIAWVVKDISWLAITLGCIALCAGLMSAYGIGKHSEM